MPNGQDLLTKLDFDERIQGMTAKERSLFTAQAVYQLSLKCPKMEIRVASLERGSKKASGVTGGITSGIVVALYAIIDFLIGKGG